MLSPYECGSGKSKLIDYFEPSHYNVQVSDAEKRMIACWIDLGVPFCGSYVQANTWATPNYVWKNTSLSWKGPIDKIYEYYQKKRVVFACREIESIKSLMAGNVSNAESESQITR